MAKILALGDCNTLGIQHLKDNSYPERFANTIGQTINNCGFTMSTTNEMLHFFRDFKKEDTEIILIQYGLVDSWKTFKYAPYILYYPDNRWRKLLRKIVKKYKKIVNFCRRTYLSLILPIKYFIYMVIKNIIIF